jgi:hypothetical protein
VSARKDAFDPWAIVDALERHRVNYVLIGALAGVLHGTDEITSGVDICPQVKDENVERLQGAIAELGGQLDPATLNSEPATRVATAHGELKVVPQPPGSGGWEDIRRGSTREALGHGVRAPVASVNDLGRLMTSLGRREDVARLAVLRRLAELDHVRGIER